MKQRLLRLLRVRELPDPPPGSGESLQVFRSSRRDLTYSILSWSLKQTSGLIGLLFSLAFFQFGQDFVRRFRVTFGVIEVSAATLLGYLEIVAAVGFVLQLVFTGLLLKLSWELRWYMVGEEALRIRQGLWSVREQTMTLANIQNLIVRQGPIQRLFGIATLEVQTAGGGSRSRSDDDDEARKSVHVGRLRGLDDAQGLRDRIHSRVVRSKGAGLGDIDDVVAAPPSTAVDIDLLHAAESVRDEARALRRTVTARAH